METRRAGRRLHLTSPESAADPATYAPMTTPSSDPRHIRLRQQLLFSNGGGSLRLYPPGFRGPRERLAEQSDQLYFPSPGDIQVSHGLVIAGRSWCKFPTCKWTLQVTQGFCSKRFIRVLCRACASPTSGHSMFVVLPGLSPRALATDARIEKPSLAAHRPC